MKLRLKQVDVITPQGVRIQIEAQTAEGSLQVCRYDSHSKFVDVRDEGLPPYETDKPVEGENARLVATYPASWGFEYSWEVTEA